MITKIIIKTAKGTMGFAELEVEDESESPPSYLVDNEGNEFDLVDWCGQFSGPSFPVYQEVSK